MHRPDLARILVERAEPLGARIHWGTKVENLNQDDDGVELVWHDDGGRSGSASTS